MPAQCATVRDNLEIVTILLANTGKSLKFYRFETVQSLLFSFFLDSKFIHFRLLLIFFTAAASIVLNLFSTFEQNELRAHKIVLIKKHNINIYE